MHRYQVVVGNIGTVYDGDSYREAVNVLEEYVSQSVNGYGRASDEDVTLFKDGDLKEEHAANDLMAIDVLLIKGSAERRARYTLAQWEYDNDEEEPYEAALKAADRLVDYLKAAGLKIVSTEEEE